MSRSKTCPYCSKQLTKDDNIKEYKNRSYHISCYKNLMKEKYAEEKESYDPRDELYNYICLVYGIDEVSPMIKSQIDKYMADNGKWKYSGILYTIKYVNEIEGVNFKNNPNIKGIGYVPYKYEEAKRYYMNLIKVKKSLNEQLEDRDIKDFITNKKIVIKPINYETSHRAMIDIDKL